MHVANERLRGPIFFVLPGEGAKGGEGFFFFFSFLRVLQCL
jgi:hypothetical protein